MPKKANEVPDKALTLESSDVDQDQHDKMRAIRTRFDVHQSFWSEIHNEALEDDKFIAGEQWPEPIRQERKDDDRPCLTYNLLPSFTRQITNKIRQERPQIKVVPVETNKGQSPKFENVQGTKDYSAGDVYSGIIKNIEHISRAEQAYDTAVKHAVDHGFGYFYLMPEWSTTNPFVQELVVHRVKNSYSIYLDPDSQEADYRDAKDGFIFYDMKRTTFEDKYPEASLTEFGQPGMGSNYEGWWDGDNVRIAQYFWIEYHDDEVLMLSNGKIVYKSEVEDILDDIEEEWGVHILKENGEEMRRQVKRPVCMWQKMTANDILEGPVQLPFSAIPIFIVTGEEMIVDGKTRYESAIRHAKDPQRSYNYWRTAAAETVALAPRAPWVGTEKQFEGFEDLYEEANARNVPYLPYNPDERAAGPPQRNYPASIPAAELQNATQDGMDMQTIIGLHDASLGRESNEKSGKAIIARQQQGSTSTFQFPDNLARAQEQMGRLMVEAIPQLYDTNRIMRIRLPDGADDFVEINATATDAESGKTVLVRDIAYGKYDVVMETGTDYATQRQEAADTQMELLKVLGPDQARNIVHLIVKNLGIPGSEEVAGVLRRMLPDQLKSEEERLADLPKGVQFDEQGNMVNEDGSPYQPPLTQEMQIMQKANEVAELEHKASIAKSEADMAGAEADKEQARAKVATAEAQLEKARIELEKLRQEAAAAGGQDNAQMLGEVEKIIRQVMSEHEINPEAHKDATADQVSEAVVEALERIKAYVDRKQGSQQQLVASATPAPAANGSEESSPSALNVTVVQQRPGRLEFEYDENGNLLTASPDYEDEGQA